MAEWLMEWRNGVGTGKMVEWQEWQPNGGMVEWQEWRLNGGMAEWQEWWNGGMAEWHMEWQNGGMVEWLNDGNGRNSGNEGQNHECWYVRKNGTMAEWQKWKPKYY